jgi:hypothetical protein
METGLIVYAQLWYAGGAFDHSRWMCKQLVRAPARKLWGAALTLPVQGLLIQARYLGLWKA